MKLSKSKTKTFIAIPENHGETLHFENKKDLQEYSQLKKEMIEKAIEEGFSVYIAGKRYFIDEDLS